MSSKTLIWGGMMIGSTVGSLVPYLWDGGAMAYAVWGAIGGFAGIWAGYTLAKGTGAL